MNTFDVLRVFTPILMVIVTFILVLITRKYALTTEMILGESRNARMDSSMPMLMFRFLGTGKYQLREVKGEELEVEVISTRIVNVGLGPARNIRLRSNFSEEECTEYGSIKPHFGKDQLINWQVRIDDCLGIENGNPDMQISFFEAPEYTPLHELKAQFEIKYKDVYGREYVTRFFEKKHTFDGPFI